jgi:hypothetical protein
MWRITMIESHQEKDYYNNTGKTEPNEESNPSGLFGIGHSHESVRIKFHTTNSAEIMYNTTFQFIAIFGTIPVILTSD